MKTYTKEELLNNPPLGATHLLIGVCGYSYIKHYTEGYRVTSSKPHITYIRYYTEGYRVWLGVKHGGWSIKLDYKHPNFDKLISVSNN